MKLNKPTTDIHNDPNYLALLARSRNGDDFPRRLIPGAKRFDLALLERGFPITMIKNSTKALVVLARQVDGSMGPNTGGAWLGFDENVLRAMEERWGLRAPLLEPAQGRNGADTAGEAVAPWNASAASSPITPTANTSAGAVAT